MIRLVIFVILGFAFFLYAARSDDMIIAVSAFGISALMFSAAAFSLRNEE